MMMAAPLIGGDPQDVRAGGFPAWPLPLDATGAGVARSLVRAVFGVLVMPERLTYDTTLAVSELATNAYVHAYGGERPEPASAPPELWAYLRWRSWPEVVLKVFDSGPWPERDAVVPSRPPLSAESGRGLEVAHALAALYGGRCGMHRTWSRLGARPVAGKAAFITVPVPPTCPAAATPPMSRSAHEVAEWLFRLLETRGLNRLQRTKGHGMTVICVRAGVHIWIREDEIAYCVPGHGGVRLALCDGVEAIEQIVRHCADLDASCGPPGMGS